MDIDNLLNDKFIISYISTESLHKEYPKKILAKLSESNPEWRNTIYILSRLSLLSWASLERSNAPHHFSCDAVDVDEDELLLISDAACSLVKNNIDNLSSNCRAVIKGIHVGSSDVSTYLLNEYYENAAKELCILCYLKVNLLCEKIIDIYSEIPSEEQIAFHDIGLIFSLNKRHVRSGAPAFDLEPGLQLLQASEHIKSCKVCSNDLYMILTEYIKGINETEIARNIGKSRTYVRNRIYEGQTVISTLFWGLATQDFFALQERTS